MNTRRIVACAAAVLLPLVLMGEGCETQPGDPTDAGNGLKVMADGHHTITKAMRGFWSSAGGPGCEWAKVDRYGNPTGDGKGSATQRVLFNTADVGGFFLSDNCRAWSKK